MKAAKNNIAKVIAGRSYSKERFSSNNSKTSNERECSPVSRRNAYQGDHFNNITLANSKSWKETPLNET